MQMTDKWVATAQDRALLARFCLWLHANGVHFAEDGPVRSDRMLVNMFLGLDDKATEQEDAALPAVEFVET